MVQAIFLARFLAGAVTAGGALALSPQLLGCVLSWSAATVFAYLLNGVMDVDEDRANGSRRPIAAGLLPREAALRVCALLVAASVLLGRLFGGPVFLAALVAYLVCGYAYSAPPFECKRTSGGTVFTVTLLGLLTYAAGTVGSGPLAAASAASVVLAVAMTLWMCCVGALAKDLSDVTGDASAKRRTMAVRRGAPRTRRVIAVNALSVAVLFTAAAWRWAPALLPVAVTVTGSAVVVAALALWPRLVDTSTRLRRRRPYRAFMATQFAAHLLAIGIAVL
jgi:4-hydroxybenzoate polyprenyltransferase